MNKRKFSGVSCNLREFVLIRGKSHFFSVPPCLRGRFFWEDRGQTK